MQTVKVKKILLLLTILWLCSCKTLLYASEKLVEITARGAGGISDGIDPAIARDDALRDAKRNAVETGLGTYIKSTTEVENLMVVRDNILSHSEGYIDTYKVEKEWQEGNLYYVEIRAKVRAAKATEEIAEKLNTLCMLQEAAHRPRVMVLAREKIDNKWLEDSSSVIEFNRILTEKCFNVVDEEQMNKIREKDVLSLIESGNNTAAVKLARQFNADWVVVGQGGVTSRSCSKLAEQTSFLSCKARTRAKIVRTETGQVIASKEEEFGGVSDSGEPENAAREGFKNVAGMLSDYFIQQVIKQWSPAGREGGACFTTILGVTGANHKQITALKSALKKLRGYCSINPIQFTAKGLSKFEYSAQFTGEELCDKLENIKVQNLKFEITNCSLERIDLRVM